MARTTPLARAQPYREPRWWLAPAGMGAAAQQLLPHMPEENVRALPGWPMRAKPAAALPVAAYLPPTERDRAISAYTRHKLAQPCRDPEALVRPLRPLLAHVQLLDLAEIQGGMRLEAHTVCEQSACLGSKLRAAVQASPLLRSLDVSRNGLSRRELCLFAPLAQLRYRTPAAVAPQGIDVLLWREVPDENQRAIALCNANGIERAADAWEDARALLDRTLSRLTRAYLQAPASKAPSAAWIAGCSDARHLDLRGIWSAAPFAQPSIAQVHRLLSVVALCPSLQTLDLRHNGLRPAQRETLSALATGPAIAFA